MESQISGPRPIRALTNAAATRRSATLLAALAIAVVLTAGLPFGDFQNHPHWTKVAWIPFVSPPIKVTDCLLNIVLFIPVGYLLRPASSKRRLVATSMLVVVLSAACEYAQVYSHSRIPSLTDVCCNVIGGALGAAAAFQVARGDRLCAFSS